MAFALLHLKTGSSCCLVQVKFLLSYVKVCVSKMYSSRKSKNTHSAVKCSCQLNNCVADVLLILNYFI